MSAPQPEFDFDDPKAAFELKLRDQWAKNERDQAHQWTREALCLAWVTGSDGTAWQDWWKAQPNYTQAQMLNEYDYERWLADTLQRPMRSYRQIRSGIDAMVAQDLAIAKLWAHDIREAALAGKPMPYREHEEMSGAEHVRFRSLLRMAVSEAGVVIIDAQAPEPSPKSRRKKLTSHSPNTP